MEKNYTEDTFFNGNIHIRQQSNGYRFSIDAALVADYTKPNPGDRILDLGTGCGIIPLMLAYRNQDISIFGVEIQKELAEIAAHNVRINHMQERIFILLKDMKKLRPDLISGTVDIVVCNPPFKKVGTGKINPNQQKAVARHELKVDLKDVIETAKRLLPVSGRFVVVYPSERLADILSQMRIAGIEPKNLRIIHSYKNTEAKLVLAEGVRGGNPGLTIDPPLVIYDVDGSYTDEVEKMFGS